MPTGPVYFETYRAKQRSPRSRNILALEGYIEVLLNAGECI